MIIQEPFKIELHDISFEAIPYLIGKAEVYRLTFSDGRPALNVTEAMGRKPFWTSIPQGRQVEAEFFGQRIAEHLRKSTVTSPIS